MQVKINTKLTMICLLVCFLFLMSFISVLNTNGILSANTIGSGVSPVSGERSSMASGIDSDFQGYLNYIDSSAEFSVSSIKQARGLSTKTNFDVLALTIPAQVSCLLDYLRVSEPFASKSFSSLITIFLHKKDGMK